MIITIPYQNHVNKKIFDYFLLCNNQINNINFANNLLSFASTTNQNNSNQIFVYVSYKLRKIYLFCSLSKKLDTNIYNKLLNFWSEIKVDSFNFNDGTTVDTENIDDDVFLFNIKNFYSVLSFSSSYKDRYFIDLHFNNSNLFYKISDTITIDLAHKIPENSDIYVKIKESYNKYNSHKKDNLSDIILDVTNVNKNYFLLPFSNYNSYLNFLVASQDNKAYLYNKDGYNYLVSTLIKDNKIQFCSFIYLKNDKFIKNDFYKDKLLSISPGVIQLLVISQNNKFWKKLNIYKEYSLMYFNDANINNNVNNYIYCSFDKVAYVDEDIIDKVNIDNLFYTDNCYLVGKLTASEILLLNKLFTNSLKDSYFDFSLQKFVGSGYVFSDSLSQDNNNKNCKKEVELSNKITSAFPLKLLFTELKHYIGSDLSQKDFVLYIYTDGTNVIIDKMDKTETIKENRILFNHIMSKNYLKI